ncbi:RecF/RecN/SMC N terminal domain-containing protein [Massariosphaeria phaeospora]|uniref:RecF/RecN/SMC N terminal domain-containing protein n=1 Tax=Massariosphaeria phaeospora TaxID=100035 RepID=A0A7C8MK78_9PLEO|nr:RecF/RecN/SMC N terminal domain-containing protein [Massariosphaeria phaeospora]
MKVVEVVIDGFKSYAVRTVISGWDESFNSITGLNGSGKSNILDAICFVLGITNMSTVRAQNLQDLIYKRGQAGVTKASVTIVFDNRDKTKSPIGFEDSTQISVMRQIVLGGTSKYLINGHRAQQQTVQNLFQSVQLNINNPNFLIMQGRITKVLNMKAVEILAMIEEAAGTRMFEDRRDKAFKTMAKKEMKVQELAELLRDEIDPKLEKLRQEKRAFLDFQQTQSDLERLTRLVVAYDYIRYKEKLRQSADDLEAKKQRTKGLEASAVRMKKEIEFLEEDIKKVKTTREKELRKGGKFQALEEEVKTHSHEVVRLTTAFDLAHTSLTEETDREREIERSVQELEKQLKDKTAFYEKMQEKHKTAHDEFARQTEDVEKKEELLQTLQTGVASKEGQESGYQGQLHDARNRASAAATEQEQNKLKIAHLEKQIKEDEPKAKKATVQNSGLLKDLEALKTQAKKLEAELSKMGFEPGKESDLYQQETDLQNQIRELRQQADGMKRRVANIDFSYNDPSPHFDRSRVKGLVAQLFTLEKAHTRAGTALEICAGGRLYNVVVDTAETGTQLLQNGKLKKRVTIIPLNKISDFKVSAAKMGAVQKIAPGKADLALSLIGYDDTVSAAMNFVFGSTLVCEDAETAKRVTFDPSVHMKSVTLEGDVYDPSGTLSGGSAPHSSGVLVTLQQLNELNRELQSREKELVSLQATMAREKKKLDATRQTKQELDLKTHEIKLTEEQISGNSSSSIIQAVEEMKQSVTQLKEDVMTAKIRQDEAQKDIKHIERDMNEFNDNKDSKLAELQSSLEKLKKTLSKTSASLKPLQAELREAMVESQQCSGDLTAANEQLEDIRTTLKAQQEEIDALTAKQAGAKDAHDLAQANLADEQAKLTGFDDELRALEEAVRSKNSLIAEEGLEQQKLGHEIERFHKERDASTSNLKALESEHEWIADESELFGRAGTPYDFRGQNMSDCKARRKNMQERFQGMKNKINPKVMAMIDSVEKKEASLKRNMATVVKDKKKIEETIVKLDEYKKEALHKTWTKVNGDFGQIFNEILPGSFAKLEPPEGKTIADGLEVRVMLGKVWKQSLTELSGGQRSLIALSLIMALLQFKPAPMYILDEVDAALDPSHTQNIGRLIKMRFKGSQFIVVSLKDGMFENANRIFRTRFVDGTSCMDGMDGMEGMTWRRAFFLDMRCTWWALDRSYLSTARVGRSCPGAPSVSPSPLQTALATDSINCILHLPPPVLSSVRKSSRVWASLQDHADHINQVTPGGSSSPPDVGDRREGIIWAPPTTVRDPTPPPPSPPSLEELMRQMSLNKALRSGSLEGSKLRPIYSFSNQVSHNSSNHASHNSSYTLTRQSTDLSAFDSFDRGASRHGPDMRMFQSAWADPDRDKSRSGRNEADKESVTRLSKLRRLSTFMLTPAINRKASDEKTQKSVRVVEGQASQPQTADPHWQPKGGLKDRRKINQPGAMTLTIPPELSSLPARGRPHISPDIQSLEIMSRRRARSPKTPFPVQEGRTPWELPGVKMERPATTPRNDSDTSKPGRHGMLRGSDISPFSPPLLFKDRPTTPPLLLSNARSTPGLKDHNTISGAWFRRGNSGASDSGLGRAPDGYELPEIPAKRPADDGPEQVSVELKKIAKRSRRWQWSSSRASNEASPTKPTPRQSSESNFTFTRFFKSRAKTSSSPNLQTNLQTSGVPNKSTDSQRSQEPTNPDRSLSNMAVPPVFIPPGLNRINTPPMFDNDGELKGKLGNFFFDYQNPAKRQKHVPGLSPAGHWDSDAVLMSLERNITPSGSSNEESPQRLSPLVTPGTNDDDRAGGPSFLFALATPPSPTAYHLAVLPRPGPPPHTGGSEASPQTDWFRRASQVPEDSMQAALREAEERAKFEWIVPEHLPTSPLCPLSPKYHGKLKKFCYWHSKERPSRRESRDMTMATVLANEGTHSEPYGAMLGDRGKGEVKPAGTPDTPNTEASQISPDSDMTDFLPGQGRRKSRMLSFSGGSIV